jgi:hypothetical protein
MAKAVRIDLSNDWTVFIPVHDARWLAGELRRASGRGEWTPARTAADAIERSVYHSEAPNVTFGPGERSAVAALLRVDDIRLSEPLRLLRRAIASVKAD